LDVSPARDGGVLKKVLKPGDGEVPPGADQSKIDVKVHYTGWLLDGKKFDSSRDKGELFSFTLHQGQVIKGWDIGVATMRSGEKARFRIREDYAYGKDGSGESIPGGATLVFDVELDSFKRVEKKKWELSKEEKIAGAEKEKAAGNAAFGAGKTEEAFTHYKEALDFLSYFYSDEEKKLTQATKVSCNLNAAACCVKLSKWKDVLKYAEDVLKIEDTNVKVK
jgi:peptidylprolyl isomerase